MMNFPEGGWSLPEKGLEYYVKRYGGNLFSLRSDGTALGHDPEDPRWDPLLLKDQVHKYADRRDLDALDNSSHVVGFHPR